jgi:hypothetical protein
LGPFNIFLSYKEDDGWWVKKFCDYFFTNDSLVRDDWVLDPVPGGERVGGALNRGIASAHVVIAFIGQNYKTGYTLKEFSEACRLHLESAAKPLPPGKVPDRRKPRIIPILLGRAGSAWWEELRDGRYKNTVLGDIADLRKFINGTEKLVSIDHDPAWIMDLRNDTLDWLRGEAANAGQNPGLAVPATLRDVTDIVLLGSPFGPQNDGLAVEVADVARQLETVKVNSWPDNWIVRLPDQLAQTDSKFFVQPVSGNTADTHVEDPHTTRLLISRALPPASNRAQADGLPQSCRIVIWHPAGDATPARFRDKALSDADSNPAFRNDPPASLAAWLSGALIQNGDKCSGFCEDIERNETANGNKVAHLPRLLEGLAKPYLNDEAPPWYTFRRDKFAKLFDETPPRRAIVFANDSRLSMQATRGNDRQLHKELINLLKELQNVADPELEKAKINPLDEYFWVACIGRGQKILRDTDSPPGFDLSRWNILTVNPDNYVPLPESQESIARKLKNWYRPAKQNETASPTAITG